MQVEDHSFYFIGPDVDVAILFGIYDLAQDSGWVNVGTDHDTSVFAVGSIRRWWQARGRMDYPDADRRLKGPGAHGKPLLSNADRLLVTVIYLSHVCSQKVLVDLLAINPVTIGQVIGETRTLIDAQKITVSQTAHYFSSAQELRAWGNDGATTCRMDLSQTLSHPALTGMPDRITVPYQDRTTSASSMHGQRMHAPSRHQRVPGARPATPLHGTRSIPKFSRFSRLGSSAGIGQLTSSSDQTQLRSLLGQYQ